MKQFRTFLYVFFSLFIAFTLLIGCGGGGEGSDIHINLDNNSNYVSLCGVVQGGSSNSIRTASELRFSLGNNLSDIRVFIEDNNSIYGITDNEGRFLINGVPEGYHSIIAEKKEGGEITFRQRLYNVDIKGIANYYELPTPISIVPSPYSLNLIVTDNNNKPINNAKITLWGTEHATDNKGFATSFRFAACGIWR